MDIAAALLDLIQSPEAIVTLGLTLALTGAIKGVMPAAIRHNPTTRHLLPLLPVLIALMLAMIPGWLPGASWGDRSLVAVAVGLAAPWFYGVLKRRPLQLDVEAPPVAPR